MVFQKKGGGKAKQTPKKNKVELNDDFNYESDSDQTVKKTPKTPAAKTPKVKQSQSDKKVSFQIPGNNIPAKMPMNENFLVGKKPTPAKMSLKEFQGFQAKAQKNGYQKKQSLDDGDDDDDDDFDMLMGGNEGGDDEEEFSENKKADMTSTKNSSLKISTSSKKTSMKKENLKGNREGITLYIGNLPEDVTATELKALSTDIVNVNLPPRNNKRKRMFAFLDFKSEEKAEENYNSLQKKMLRNVPVFVDYTGERRINKDASKIKMPMNLKKLCVQTLPADVTIAQFAGFFPNAFQITINDSSSHRSATINYLTEESAAADLEACKSAVLNGNSLLILYAVYREERDRKGRKRKSKSSQNAKRIKLEKKRK